MFSLSDFNVDKSLINEDLSLWITFYNNTTSEKMKKTLLKEFESIEDYIYILYWLRFYQKMDYEEIGKLIRPSSKNAHNIAYCQYIGLNWNYSNNFNNVKEHYLKEMQISSDIKDKVCTENIRNLTFTAELEKEYKEFYKKYKAVKKKTTRSNEFYLNIGYYDLEDCIRAFYFLIRICNLSTYQVARIYGISPRTAQSNLRNFGLLSNHETSQKNAVKFNRRKYDNIMNAGRKTMNESLFIHGNIGSNRENLVRNLFASYIINYIDIKVYEVIVGINNRNIIAPKEVDIPVIIINTENNYIYKFAIEFNGDVYHKDGEKDLIKKQQLEDKNWIFFSIWQYSSTKIQSEKGEIEEQIMDICFKINKTISVKQETIGARLDV